MVIENYIISIWLMRYHCTFGRLIRSPFPIGFCYAAPEFEILFFFSFEIQIGALSVDLPCSLELSFLALNFLPELS